MKVKVKVGTTVKVGMKVKVRVGTVVKVGMKVKVKVRVVMAGLLVVGRTGDAAVVMDEISTATTDSTVSSAAITKTIGFFVFSLIFSPPLPMTDGRMNNIP